MSEHRVYWNEVSSFDDLAEHAGHTLRCVVYDERNAVIECMSCLVVLVGFDRHDAAGGGT